MQLFRNGRFAVVTGDITRLQLDAIVNPSNPDLNGAMGVDAAIHKAAGPDLARACQKLAPVDFGQACITPGFKLPAKAIIHVAGPVWRDGSYDEETELSLTYDAALELARQHRVRSIAFPAISTGTYAFPIETATAVALTACRVYLDEFPDVFTRITFCAYTEADTQVYLRQAQRFLS
ncbi:MAG: macro domain-containing protein [Myxococcota bacterium]